MPPFLDVDEACPIFSGFFEVEQKTAHVRAHSTAAVVTKTHGLLLMRHQPDTNIGRRLERLGGIAEVGRVVQNVLEKDRLLVLQRLPLQAQLQGACAAAAPTGCAAGTVHYWSGTVQAQLAAVVLDVTAPPGALQLSRQTVCELFLSRGLSDACALPLVGRPPIQDRSDRFTSRVYNVSLVTLPVEDYCDLCMILFFLLVFKIRIATASFIR